MSSTAIPITFLPEVRNVSKRGLTRKKLLALVSASLLFVALILQLSVRIAIIQKSYAIENLRQENLEKDQQLRALKLRYESSINPQQLKIRARQELGMNNVRPQQVRQIIIQGE